MAESDAYTTVTLALDDETRARVADALGLESIGGVPTAIDLRIVPEDDEVTGFQASFQDYVSRYPQLRASAYITGGAFSFYDGATQATLPEEVIHTRQFI